MDFALKIALYGIAGLVLLWANLWFISSAVEAFSTPHLPDTIAPVRIVGVEDKDGKAGQALAQMLLARLGNIRQDITASAAQLRTPIADPEAPRTQELSATVPLAVPERLFEPIDVAMKVGGVEVGGFFTWAHRSLASDNALKLTVQTEKSRAVVAGVWNGGKDSLWIDVRGDEGQLVPNDKIASAIAYALAQKQFANRVPEVGAFTPEEFQNLLATLSDVATLQRQVALGRVAISDYGALLLRIETLVERTPRWNALVQLAATLAENGGRLDKAVDYYSRAALLSEGDLKLRAALELRVAKLSERLAEAQPKHMAALAPGAAKKPAAWLHKLLGVESLRMSRKPRVAILGGPPVIGTLHASRFDFVGSPAGKTDPTMSEYIRTVVQAIEIVAPEAHFIFAHSAGKDGSYTKAMILAEIDALISAKPEIILITLGPLTGEAFKHIFEHLVSNNIVVVVAAGNEGDKKVAFEGEPILHKIMVVSSVSRVGKRSAFSQHGKVVAWAPGEQIPVRPVDEQVQLRSGTTYAAALAAGVAARVLAETDLDAEQLVGLLRETAVPVKEKGDPVLNLAAALKKVQSTENGSRKAG